jgi:hypothetical protein
MSNCFCGNPCVVTSHHAYAACISCMRLLIDSYGREGNTDAEYDLWDRILPNVESEPFDVEYHMENWISVFFFDGNQYERLLAEDPQVCQVTSCLNVPDKDETICYSCWTIHENADLPGFPSEYEGDDQLGGCGTCNSPTNDWFCETCYKTQDVIHIAAQEEEVLTQCTDSCKEMGMMSEGCEFCK